MDNKMLLKSLQSGKDTSKQGSSKVTIPGLATLKKTLGKASPKQLVDVALFSCGIYLMYKFGKYAADSLDSQMPSEKAML